jgi:hypothetical protein
MLQKDKTKKETSPLTTSPETQMEKEGQSKIRKCSKEKKGG